MKTSKQIRRESKQLFRLCLVNESLDEPRVREVVQAVLESKRRGTHALLSSFLRLVRLDLSQHTAEVESATLLSADLRASVLTGIEQAYGRETIISFSLKPALIGGMRIRVANDVYDGSVKAGLAALEKRF
jgi:F-type H+-transporting ATPase subunit delta